MIPCAEGTAGGHQVARPETPRTKVTWRGEVELMAAQDWRDNPTRVLRRLLQKPCEAEMCMKMQPLSQESEDQTISTKIQSIENKGIYILACRLSKKARRQWQNEGISRNVDENKEPVFPQFASTPEY